MEASRILGYKLQPELQERELHGPELRRRLPSRGGLDVNQPIMGPTDTHVDMWLGYTRKVYKNVNWRVQLNLKSVGEKDHLTPSQYEPDGSLALARIQQGMGGRSRTRSTSNHPVFEARVNASS
jgi:hypothetical protein